MAERRPGAEEEQALGHYMAGSAHVPKLRKTNMGNQGVIPRPTDDLLQDRPYHPSIPQPTRGQRVPRGLGNQRGPGWTWAVHLKSPTPLTPKGEDHQEWSRVLGWAEEGTGQRGHEDSWDRVRTVSHSWAKDSALHTGLWNVPDGICGEQGRVA